MILEDDLPLAHALKDLVVRQGWSATLTHSLRETRMRVGTDVHFDLALMDVSLPDGSALELASELRRDRSKMPLFFLSAKDDEATIVDALSLGADDYLTKPFRVSELVLRLKRSLSRSAVIPGSLTRRLGALTVYSDEGRLVDGTGAEVSLTALEWRILSLFLDHRGQLMTRSILLDRLADMTGEYLNDNTLTVYINRLRRRIEADPTHPVLLETVRGLGYRLASEDEKP